MSSTEFLHLETAFPRVRGYDLREGRHEPVEPWTVRALGLAGATVWSTVSDLARFARLHLDDGHLPDGTLHSEGRPQRASLRPCRSLDPGLPRCRCLGWGET
jgi:CubicO group peptidase (beta-lactamase class C family)